MGSAYTAWDDAGEYYYCPNCYAREEPPPPTDAEVEAAFQVVADVGLELLTWRRRCSHDRKLDEAAATLRRALSASEASLAAKDAEIARAREPDDIVALLVALSFCDHCVDGFVDTEEGSYERSLGVTQSPCPQCGWISQKLHELRQEKK